MVKKQKQNVNTSAIAKRVIPNRMITKRAISKKTIAKRANY